MPGARKAFNTLLSCESFSRWLLQLRRDILEIDDTVQVQGEMDVAGGQVEGIGRAVVVVVEMQLKLPNGLRLVKAVPLEHVPPLV